MYFFHYYNYATSFPFKRPQLYFFTQVLILISLPSLLQFYKLKICWRIEPNIDTLYILFFWWIIIRNYTIVMLYLQKKKYFSLRSIFDLQCSHNFPKNPNWQLQRKETLFVIPTETSHSPPFWQKTSSQGLLASIKKKIEF